LIHTHARNTLDTHMRRLLAQLELISAIPAANYDASHGSEEALGGSRPPGDYGYRTYAAWYGPPFHEKTPDNPGCLTDSEREECITAAQAELDHLRKGAPVDPSSMETHEAMRARMLVETEGWSLQAVVQSHWRMSTTMIRRARITAGRDAETGLPERHTEEPGEDLASRAKAMKKAGMSLRGIGMALGGLDQKQVQRFLKKVA
jgi:hypothetical protein